MTAKTYGSKYQETKELHLTDLARLIRAEIKERVKAGELPPLTYSVRTRHGRTFTGAIDVQVKGFEATHWTDTRSGKRSERFAIVSPEFARDPNTYGGSVSRYTPEAQALLARLEGIRNAYNYDASDPTTDYFDTRYYGDSDFDGAEESAQRERLAAEAPIPSPPAPAAPVAPQAALSALAAVSDAGFLFPTFSDPRYPS
jgi:hypothetical protein